MTQRAFAGLLLAAITVCCSKQSTTPERRMQPAAGIESPTESRDNCPIAVPGARVQLQAMDDALALTFTAPTGELARLRERVRHLADACTTCGTSAASLGVEDLP